MRPHHSGDNLTTEGLKALATNKELSSNIKAPKMWENYENTKSTEPFKADDSDKDLSPAIVLPGLSGVHS